MEEKAETHSGLWRILDGAPTAHYCTDRAQGTPRYRREKPIPHSLLSPGSLLQGLLHPLSLVRGRLAAGRQEGISQNTGLAVPDPVEAARSRFLPGTAAKHDLKEEEEEEGRWERPQPPRMQSSGSFKHPFIRPTPFIPTSHGWAV